MLTHTQPSHGTASLFTFTDRDIPLAYELRALSQYLRIHSRKLPKIRTLIRESLQSLAPWNRYRGIGSTVNVQRWQTVCGATLPTDLLDALTLAAGDERTAPHRIENRAAHSAAVIEGAITWTNALTHRTVFDASGRAWPEFSSYRRSPPTRNRQALKPTRTLSGTTLNLYGPIAMAGGNFGHWMDDGVARAFLAERAGLFDQAERVLVPPTFHDFHRESLYLLGFDDACIVELAPLEVLGFERLVCTSAPRGTCSSIHPHWSSVSFRRLAGVDSERTGSRRIYISRRDATTRQFDNEAAIIETLVARNFEIIELSKFDLRGKIDLFSDASAVVGLTGAGLATAMFMPGDALLLELFPPAFIHYNVASTCSSLGIHYDWLVVDDASALGQMNRYFGNLHLEPAVLARRLDALGLT